MYHVVAVSESLPLVPCDCYLGTCKTLMCKRRLRTWCAPLGVYGICKRVLHRAMRKSSAKAAAPGQREYRVGEALF